MNLQSFCQRRHEAPQALKNQFNTVMQMLRQRVGYTATEHLPADALAFQYEDWVANLGTERAW